ncbi:hypothetical protein BCR33DRAFT_746125 [Rhizoclosmatium globosum]|uniref:Uncharacterized protein n=1 Tax=Rhizoclosmatium globosum TaxID=329046 RepID=A0A1Y2AXI3_9FUNG|nr:hypothetical protein BCR33DRAFT_746125 [Rhizoclosmatium globosum]|eukprot:ORY27299.1 hypothetical protein BCR33DRAFT_746125 [Rhizoclosmatium globosum]
MNIELIHRLIALETKVARLSEQTDPDFSGVNIASSTPVDTTTLHTNLSMKAYYARILFLESQACLIDERIHNISSDAGNQEEQSLMHAYREEIYCEDNATLLCVETLMAPSAAPSAETIALERQESQIVTVYAPDTPVSKEMPAIDFYAPADALKYLDFLSSCDTNFDRFEALRHSKDGSSAFYHEFATAMNGSSLQLLKFWLAEEIREYGWPLAFEIVTVLLRMPITADKVVQLKLGDLITSLLAICEHEEELTHICIELMTGWNKALAKPNLNIAATVRLCSHNKSVTFSSAAPKSRFFHSESPVIKAGSGNVVTAAPCLDWSSKSLDLTAAIVIWDQDTLLSHLISNQHSSK